MLNWNSSQLEDVNATNQAILEEYGVSEKGSKWLMSSKNPAVTQTLSKHYSTIYS